MSKHFKSYCLQFDDPRIIEIDDATEVYGDGDGWPDVDDPCDLSPSGHHEFNCVIDPEICLHCKRRC